MTTPNLTHIKLMAIMLFCKLLQNKLREEKNVQVR